MQYKFTIACQTKLLKEVRDFIRTHLIQHGIPEQLISLMVLAVDEVCANVVIHGNDCNPSDRLEIKMIVKDGKEISFEIKDQGKAFDSKSYKEPDLDKIVETRKQGGMGLMLVKRIMDEVEFRNIKGINICHLRKGIQAAG